MKITKITACIIPLLFVGGCTLGVAGVDAGSSVMVSSVLALFALPFVGLIENSIDRKRHPEKYAKKKRRREAERQAYEKAQK
jgi:hypothetical protein